MDENAPDSATSEMGNTLVLQLDEYLTSSTLPEDEDPLLYWKCNRNRFPELSVLASASSASVERLFSIAGKIFRPERCRLSDELFEKLKFIHCNENVI